MATASEVGSEPLLPKEQTLPSFRINGHSLILWGVLGIFAWIVTVISLQKILQSPTFFGTDDPADLGPVTPLESVSLILYHFFRPICILILVAITQGVLRYPGLKFRTKQLWLLAMLSFCSAHICYGAWMARAVLQCGVVFCWLPAFRNGGYFPWDESMPKEMGPQDGMGLRANEGLWTIIVGLMFFSMFLALFIRCRSDVCQSTRVPEVHGPSPQKARVRRKQICAALTLAVLVVPGMFLLTAVMPNNFQKLHLVGGEESDRLPLVMNSTPPDAEIPGSFLKSVYVRVSDGLVLKFWVDTMIFYGFLEVLAVMAMLSLILPRFRKLLSKRSFAGCTNGEFITCVFFACMLVLWHYYWVVEKWFGHYVDGLDWKFNTGDGVKPSPVNDICELVGRALGMDSILFMSLLLLPASKNSLWLEALGISWERGLWVHRWLGIAMLTTMAGHAVAFWIRWWKLDILFHDLLHTMRYYPIYPGHPTPHHPADTQGVYGANMTIILMEVIGYPALVIMGILPLLRQRNYELFKYFHYLFLALIPAALIHAHNGWYFAIGGIAFWLVDVAIRITSSSIPCKLIGSRAYEADAGIAMLRFEKTFENPGSYCWVNVPQISVLQWHPFSLSSSPLDGFATMHIKNMGGGEFTGQLYALVKLMEVDSQQITLNVDGPYGSPLQLDDHEVLMLIAGGIGITPIHSTLRYIMHLARLHKLPPTLRIVRFAFIAKTYDMVEVFISSLQEALETIMSAVQISAKVYLTSDTSSKIEFLGFDADVRRGRPDFETIFDDLLGELVDDESVLVQLCGPQSMDAAAFAASKLRPRIAYESKSFLI